MATSTTLLNETRAQQYESIVRNWSTTFETPNVPIETFSAVYSSNIQWFDHAFQICRVGHDAIFGLYKGFLHCNSPFKAELKMKMLTYAQAIHPTPTGAVVEMIWIGRCANDIVRPDGVVAVKASGKDFETHVCMVLQIDADAGKIERIDEYYHKFWDQGKRENEYVRMTGASIK